MFIIEILRWNMIKERIKRERAKIAVQIVQKQSVHFLCFSSTGKFLNVYTLFLNIEDPNNFYYPKYSGGKSSAIIKGSLFCSVIAFDN